MKRFLWAAMASIFLILSAQVLAAPPNHKFELTLTGVPHRIAENRRGQFWIYEFKTDYDLFLIQDVNNLPEPDQEKFFLAADKGRTITVFAKVYEYNDYKKMIVQSVR